MPLQTFVYYSIPRIQLHSEGFSLSVALVPHRLQCYSKFLRKVYIKLAIFNKNELGIITQNRLSYVICRRLSLLTSVVFHRCNVWVLKRLSCNAGRQEVGGCCTRGESEESIACRWWNHLGFETQGRLHQKSKTGVAVAPQKGLMSPKFLWKRFFFSFSRFNCSHCPQFTNQFDSNPCTVYTEPPHRWKQLYGCLNQVMFLHHYLLSNALNSMKMSPQREKSIVSKQISVQKNMEREGKH